MEELRKRAETEKRRCESIGYKLMASLSTKRAARREMDLANAENAIKQVTQNLRELERWEHRAATVERMGTLSGGVLMKRAAETRQMIESHNRQMAADREQNRLRKFGGALTRKRKR